VSDVKQVDDSVKLKPKVQKYVVIFAIIVGIILLILVFSAFEFSVPPWLIYFLVFGGFLYFLATSKFSRKKAVNAGDAVYACADFVYKIDSSLPFDTSPNQNQVWPIAPDQYLVHNIPLGVTFMYSPDKGPFGVDVVPLYKVREDIETSKLFEAIGKESRLRQQLEEITAKYDVSV